MKKIFLLLLLLASMQTISAQISNPLPSIVDRNNNERNTPEGNHSLYIAAIQILLEASELSGDVALCAYNEAEHLFREVIENGYNDSDGNIYYYLFHCYYGQREKNREEYLAKAKEALLTGIKLYPKNVTILDGLMQFYSAEEGVGDPTELTEMIEALLKEDPTNYDLWFGRGRVYNAMKQYDECIKSFEKCVELRPDEFDSNFFLAYFIIEKANTELDLLNQCNVTYDEYIKYLNGIYDMYSTALQFLNKAQELNPLDEAVKEYISQINTMLYNE